MDRVARKEITKFIETASVRQLDEKRVKLEVLRLSLRDTDVIQDLDWILEQIAVEQLARIESGAIHAEHVTLETPEDQQ